MKILMAIDFPNTRTGGPARHMHYLQEEAARLGHRIDLVFSEDVANPFRGSELSGITFPFLVLSTLRRLSRARGPYDIINIHTLEGAVYAGLRKLSRKLPPCVILSHGADELRWRLEIEEARLGYRPLSWKARFLYFNLIVRQARYATRHADHIITMSSAEKIFYIKEYRMSPEKISVIPNGVDPIFFQQHEYGAAPKRLLYLGGWEWRKGIRYLVEAFSIVARRFPDVRLSAVGTGDAAVLDAFPLEIRNRVDVIPKVSAEEVPGVYASHDLFILPTLFESIPLVIPEAMAAGLPIVATRVCGIPDVLENGREALLVAPRDSGELAGAIGRLIQEASLREGLGCAAQQRARSLTWDRIAEQTLEVYHRLLSGSSGESRPL